ncbi:MAG: four helix bundle protein [Parcubacteria group bacterium]|nr:four helix bundle protein [Parcubacteria group bacterium]
MDKKVIHGYKDLIVWQKSIKLIVSVYTLTENFPKEEIYGLTSQMRRAAISVASNIAEGRMRGTKKDFSNFLRIALGSGAELETQIIVAKQLPSTKNLEYDSVDSLLAEVMKMLNVMIRKLNPREANEAIS